MQKIIKNHHQLPNNLIPLTTRAGRRWHIVWQGPRLGFVTETGNFVTTDTLSTIFLFFFVPCFLLFSFSPSVSLYVYLLCVPSSVQHSFVTTLSKYVVMWRQQQQIITYPPKYAMRTSQRVRTHSYIRTYYTLWYLYISYTIVHIYCALVYSAWYQVVPACKSSYGCNVSLIIRVHITKLHELKTALDASRGKWRCK